MQTVSHHFSVEFYYCNDNIALVSRVILAAMHVLLVIPSVTKQVKKFNLSRHEQKIYILVKTALNFKFCL